MWLTTAVLWRTSIKTVLTECPMGHERTLTIDKRKPEQEWTLTCPLCGGEHEIVAPQILRSDL
jgi:rRNA maturation protein Nop10